MKVFGCRNQQDFGGGLILVAANDKNEAFLTAAMSTKTHFVFDWMDDDGAWCEPDGNINHCSSGTYPLDKWFEFEHLPADFNECRIIIEDHYTELVMNNKKIWHDKEDMPLAKKKILAFNENGDARINYAINMALYWPKVITWAYISDLHSFIHAIEGNYNDMYEQKTK